MEKLLPEFTDYKEQIDKINNINNVKPEEHSTVHQFSYLTTSQKYDPMLLGNTEIIGRGRLIKGPVMKKLQPTDSTISGIGVVSPIGSVASMGLIVGKPSGNNISVQNLDRKHTANKTSRGVGSNKDLESAFL